MIFETAESLDAYLAPGALVDSDAPAIVAFATEHLLDCGEIEAARRSFLFVRDSVAHSWDAQARRVTRSASDALAHREGICYPKSHLLAALLRARGIPAALCYQRLTLLDDASAGYAVHALNAAYLHGAWHRLDARGNKPGLDARFSLEAERLAFAVRPELDECDYPTLYTAPHPAIVRTLVENDDALAMYASRLPAYLEER